MTNEAFKLDSDIEEEKDIVGGGNGVLDTDIYDFNIKLAYLGKSGSGAHNVNLQLEDSDGNTMRSTIYITSGKTKGQKPYFVNKAGKKQLLPGMAQVNGMCQLLLNKDLSDVPAETKTVKLYDFKAKKETPQEVEVLMELLNKTAGFAVKKSIEDKNVKDNSGEYVPSGDTRENNEIVKVMEAGTHLTLTEKAAGNTEGEFAKKWLDKWKGEVVNNAKGASDSAPKAGSPSKSSTPAESTEDLLFED